MAYESFYGGRPGAPFVIVHRFNSIQEMVTLFREGASSTHIVNYGEYVMISNNPTSENHEDNGRAYRRGMNYSDEYHPGNYENPGGGAEYIGQFTGPQGEPGGIHIIGRVNNYSDLNGKTPESIGGDDMYKGWVMAVGLNTDLPDLYAYDYTEGHENWFYIGSLPYTLITTQRTHAY